MGLVVDDIAVDNRPDLCERIQVVGFDSQIDLNEDYIANEKLFSLLFTSISFAIIFTTTTFDTYHHCCDKTTNNTQ